MKAFLSASDVARLLKVDRATITRWIKDGSVEAQQKRTGRQEWQIPMNTALTLQKQKATNESH